ncbi:translation elongation factor 4 [Patescibacteria group bacterium]|nr:translation elongation factor 4 [Patescibacteria group bacterium]
MSKSNLQYIRNFSIVAHIDHGKSTLADRLLELTETVSRRDMKEQVLDQMDLEREKGITIKLQPVTMKHGEYTLNLIDTPGHVDFSYEVSRSLAACEGALLLIDATQGIQAQTLANLYMAIEHDLEIIPVVNKIDMPNAEIDKTVAEIVDILGCQPEEILKVSAKEGTNVEQILEAIITRIPPPQSKSDQFQSLIFDSYYDDFRGVIACIRVFGGSVKKGDRVKYVFSGKEAEVLDLGIYTPGLKSGEQLTSGEVGYIITGLKEVANCQVGDTIAEPKVTTQLPGYKEMKPVVFASFYPTDATDYPKLREGLEKLKLNDAALTYEPESSSALGRGFRCGFLGLLHLEIIQERLKREYDLALVITAPSVAYQIITSTDQKKTIYTPSELPEANQIKEIREPWVKVDLVMPNEYIGDVMELMPHYRGEYQTTEYITAEGEQARVILHYEAPLASLIMDFYDKLKSVSSGYASMSYEMTGYRVSDLVKLDILVAGDLVESLSRIIPKDSVNREGKKAVTTLKDVIPPQNFQITLQAAVGGNILARENIKALRKDVTAKLYGGDVTRKRKLLEKQKKGKKKMKDMGKVYIPQEAFLAILKNNN